MGGIEGNDWGKTRSRVSNNLIMSHESGGVWDLFKFLVFGDAKSGAKFLECGEKGGIYEIQLLEEMNFSQRWVFVVGFLARKILKLFDKPMEWTGLCVEFILNLLSHNGGILELVTRFLCWKVEWPERGSPTFISAIGHIDGRIDLLDVEDTMKLGSRSLMDLCIMASKLAYENEQVVKNVVDIHWKMHFVDFYDCWNDYEEENSTHAFIACDKARDANLIMISFRGTEPFDADGWITDIDSTFYEIPEIGRVHMGFLEAIGLGNREDTSTFHDHLILGKSGTPDVGGDGGFPLQMGDGSAYYSVKKKVEELLNEHKNAKFVVTGHSLGGALAILFTTVLVVHKEHHLMRRLLGVYTYGQPRIGNRRFVRYMEPRIHPKYFRLVYCNDLVPRLPYDDETFLYEHFGVCMYYNSHYVEEDRDEEPNKNFFSIQYMIPKYVNSMWELVRSFGMGFMYGPGYKEGWESILVSLVGLAFPGLSAHSPVNYVNSVRLRRPP